MNRTDAIEIAGFRVLTGYLDATAQRRIARAVTEIAAAAPFLRPVTPGGRPMSVAMTSAGRCGWVSDRSGYRYQRRHPAGMAWPPIPQPVLAVWRALVPGRAPDTCLVNRYGAGARMGLHQDRDEGDLAWPVVSISLGDAAVFRMGGPTRRAPTRSVVLETGSVVVMGGAARLAYHGVDRIRFSGGNSLFPEGGRINLTLRVVDPAVIRD